MSDASAPNDFSTDRMAQRRTRVGEIRERAKRLLVGGATGIQAAATISEATDEFVVELFGETASALSPRDWERVESRAAVVAIGGTGRGDMAPYSDVDLLFLYESGVAAPFTNSVSEFVRGCWDAGLKLGHSVRTLDDALSAAKCDPHFATALIEARCLWGSEKLVAQLRRKFVSNVVRKRLAAFIHECTSAREQERSQFGATVQQLDPDVKRSLGGLRDLHLIRWVGFANFGKGDIDSLRLLGAIGKDDARNLLAAHEFLTRVRIDLHFAAGKARDLFSREEQLRIAEERGVEPTAGQSPVECFMQQYFRHSAVIADVARRFVPLNRPVRKRDRLARLLMTRRVNKIYLLGSDYLDIIDSYRDAACQTVEQLLTVYRLAASYRVGLAPLLAERVKSAAALLEPDASTEVTTIFLDILSTTGHLGPLLRSMFETRTLDLVLPEVSRVRSLLQFNLYHSYTVDEHTLRTIEAVERFNEDEGPLGAAYRKIRHKEIVHLALLLHDLGKGFVEDHSDVGRRIALDVAKRFQLSDDQTDVLVFLVHKHLLMSHLAFRRDISDVEALLRFSHEVGSPETLRMFYVLTAADLLGVGPGVWTDWKAELLSNLFESAMLILSGKHHQILETQRLSRVKELVRDSIVPLDQHAPDDEFDQWLDTRIDSFEAPYLTTTPPPRIAADLDVIRQLELGEISVDGKYDAETGIVDYRVILDRQHAAGCFHRITGVLTANRLDILSAEIATTSDGVVVDGFRVIDNDYDGEVPVSRIEQIDAAIRKVLTGDTTVADLFQRGKRIGGPGPTVQVSDLPTRVVIDNDSSDRCTVIDVFAHDRPGLLYTIARTAYQRDLSIELAKIATHLDQVVDVFYITDAAGQKIVERDRLHEIQHHLATTIAEFEAGGHERFA